MDMESQAKVRGEWIGFGRSDIGDVRDENQDSFLVLNDSGLWSVADGMGGHKEGGIASHLVTQSLESLMDMQHKGIDELCNATVDLLKQANESLYELSNSFYGEELVGTTVIVLLIKEREGRLIWAGDSRLYRLRNTSFELLSRDHTQYEEMVEKGLLSGDSSEGDHYSSHILTRAIGVDRNVEFDVVAIDVEEDDLFLLCSDGLSNVVEQMEIAKTIYYSEDKERAVSNLINMALARRSTDNITAVIIDRKG